MSAIGSPGLVTARADLIAGELARVLPLPRVKLVGVSAAAVSTMSPIQVGIRQGASYPIRSIL